MRAIVSLVKNPLVMAILGLLLVALIIWFIGPLIAIAGYEPLVGVVARLVLILLVVVVWGAIQLRRRLAERRADAEIPDGPAKGEAGSAAGGGRGRAGPSTVHGGPGAPQEVSRCARRSSARFASLVRDRRAAGRRQDD